MAVTPNARHLTRFPRHFSTTEPARRRRQEAQIVQACMNLDDFLPGFTRSWRHLISERSVVRISLPASSGTTRAPAGIGVRCSFDHDRPLQRARWPTGDGLVIFSPMKHTKQRAHRPSRCDPSPSGQLQPPVRTQAPSRHRRCARPVGLSHMFPGRRRVPQPPHRDRLMGNTRTPSDLPSRAPMPRRRTSTGSAST